MDRGSPAALVLLAGMGVLTAMILTTTPALAQPNANTCAREAAAIKRAEGQLPRLQVAPPDDKQIVCITLETNILFARRLAAHIEHCPRSPLARGAESWKRTESQYSATFSSRQCKPAIRSYRG
jgi:hypothetical protein